MHPCRLERRMAIPLLETKLYAPRPPRGLVPRVRLRGRLDRGAKARLTLISAPAGFGKSTLLAEWLGSRPAEAPAVAWLSLDASDNDPGPFWTYLISALRTMAPSVGVTALSLLGGPQPPPIEAVLAGLLNELGALPDDIILVLDDYHLTDAHEIQDGMAFLLEHLPPQVHLVITTRADPGLPLARLRARGELVEIRAVELRFTRDEADAYLNGMMGLGLAPGDVTALEGRTEGWIAALQLAALSIDGREDIAGFIAGFTGDDRYIVDYLVEEVLQRQPEPVRRFLLETSILGRLSGPLCDAVVGHDGGKVMLQTLDRGNLFLVSLDDRRQWYRYHQLFGDVLRAHLLDEWPDRVPDLHRRASVWYEQNGEWPEAIRHALAGQDLPRMADLIELAIPTMRRTRQEALALGWLQALPSEVVQQRPVLSVHLAGTLLLGGRPDGAERWLQEAERWMDLASAGHRSPGPWPAGMVVVDEVEYRALPCMIATYRAALALTAGDVAGTMTYARLALELAPAGDPLRLGPPAGLLALACWWNGDLEDAHHSYVVCATNLEQAGYISDVLGCAISLADIRIEQGRLHDAMRTYEQALRLAAAQDGPALRGTADMHIGMSEVFLEQGDLDAARQQLLMSREAGEHAGLEQNGYRSRVMAARIRMAEGDLDGALELLHEAERQYVSDYLPDVRPIVALQARVWVRQGKIAEVDAWAGERGLSAGDEPSYLREFEHLTLARLLLARSRQGRPDRSMQEATELLGRLLEAAEAGRRTRSVIEILMLQGLAHQSCGDTPAALESLGRAVSLAEPEGFVRIFVDEGAPMAALLELAARHGLRAPYVRRLLATIAGAAARPPLHHDLAEPLSERELDVLRLLGSDLDGPNIARELVVSLHTVRSHTKSIYAKLGVHDRRAAVRRAVDLGLLSRTSGRS